MKDIYGKIQYKDKEYILAWNFNVMSEIQDKYGSMAEWGKLTDGSGGEPNLQAVNYAVCAGLNEGIDISNEDNGTDLKPLSLKQVGRMISEIGLDVIIEVLTQTVVASTKDAEPKNA